MAAVVVLVVALVVAVVAGALYSARNGRFARRSDAGEVPMSDDRPRLDASDAGGELGEIATFVQLSSAFCAPCRATRRLLADVVTPGRRVTTSASRRRPGVVALEVDAESHLDLVRRLDVLRTPTVLLLDADGVLITRSSGLPRRDDVERLLDAVGAPASDA